MTPNQNPKDSNTNRRGFLRSVGAASIGALGASYLATNRALAAPNHEPLPDGIDEGVQEVIVLTPAENQTASLTDQAHISQVYGLRYGPNRVAQFIQGEAVEPVEYEVITDLEAETYQINEFNTLSGELGSSSETTSDGGITTQGVAAPGPFSFTAHDLVHLKLCRLKQWMKWQYRRRKTRILGRRRHPRAWNPTPAGTRWYTDWHRYIKSYQYRGRCHSRCRGQFHNDNWKKNHLRTRARLTVDQTGWSGGKKDWFGLVDFSGEDADKLHSHMRLV